MKILTRQVAAQKTAEDAVRILRSSAYPLREAKFEQLAFSMRCAKRSNGRGIWLIPVRGTISEAGKNIRVTLEIHGDPFFFLGCVIVLAGIAGLFACLVSRSNIWIPYCAMAFLGLVLCGRSLCEGCELLDLLAHKLTR